MRLRILAGKIIFWLTWPALYVILQGSLRTRVIIEADGDILLLRGWHDGGKWALPGGGVHRGEAPIASAVRETREETNIVLIPEQLVDLGQDVHQQRGIRFKLQRYGCHLKAKPNIRKQHLEVIALEWLKLTSLTEDMVTAPTWRQIEAWKQHR